MSDLTIIPVSDVSAVRTPTPLESMAIPLFRQLMDDYGSHGFMSLFANTGSRASEKETITARILNGLLRAYDGEGSSPTAADAVNFSSSGPVIADDGAVMFRIIDHATDSGTAFQWLKEHGYVAVAGEGPHAPVTVTTKMFVRLLGYAFQRGLIEEQPLTLGVRSGLDLQPALQPPAPQA